MILGYIRLIWGYQHDLKQSHHESAHFCPPFPGFGGELPHLEGRLCLAWRAVAHFRVPRSPDFPHVSREKFPVDRLISPAIRLNHTKKSVIFGPTIVPSSFCPARFVPVAQ